MKKTDRKAARAAYKQRKAPAGIYAVRFSNSDGVWVGKTADVTKIANRIRFTLDLGTSPRKSLQQAWNHHGAMNFVFEELERLGDDVDEISHERLLKDKLAQWRERLDAEIV